MVALKTPFAEKMNLSNTFLSDIPNKISPNLLNENLDKFSYNLIDESFFDQIINIDNETILKLPKGHYNHTNYPMILNSLQSGLSFGLFFEDSLIGYRLTIIPQKDDFNLGYHLGFSEDKLMKVAQFYGTLLLPKYRNKGFGQFLVKLNCELIFQKEFVYILGTAHPDNKNSLKMFYDCGFEVKKEITFYGDLPRTLLCLKSNLIY
jgi:ribosomal protein S18 acetylase RimI-like enzyme